MTTFAYSRALVGLEEIRADAEELASAAVQAHLESGEQGVPDLNAWIQRAARRDTLVVTGLERLGPGTNTIVQTLLRLHDKGVHWRVLRNPDAHLSAEGTLRALSDAQHRLRSMRVKAGMRGKHIGRPRVLSEETMAIGAELRRQGRTYKQIARVLGVGYSTAWKAFSDVIVENIRTLPRREPA